MNYVAIEYPEGVNKSYVRLLCEYLKERYHLKGTLIDLGAGTGDYYKTFQELDLYARPSEFDLEQTFPLPDKLLDVVFCKSVLEHIKDTQGFLSEVKRILKEDGRAIFLVPDWNAQWKYFYDDSTHIKPFTKKGLEQACKLAGFRVECEYFYQLPFTWRHRWLRWVPFLLKLIPDRFRFISVHVRFSKEVMLLALLTK